MMKKLLVLMLVLGMTSLASAALVVGGLPVEVMPGDVVTLTVGNDAAAAGGTIGLVLNVSQAQDGSAAVLGTWLLAPAYPAIITPVGSGLTYEFGDGTIGLNVMGDWLSATFTVPGSAALGSTVDLTWSGTLFGMTPAGASIPVIPEPTTIALLGLGGLALLRRRKK